VACESSRVAGVSARELAVAPAPGGAVIAWAGSDGLMTMDGVIAPGAFEHVVAAAVGDRVVIGASQGDNTLVFGAALGLAPYRELALIGGIAGASPVVTAGGVRLAPSVWYGGLLVATFDDSWLAHTATLAVPTPAAIELAATSVGDEAAIVWSAGGDCYVERVLDAASGVGWHEPGACRAPHLASIDSGVALAFEGDDGVHLAVAGSIDALHPASAPLVAPGARAPRIVASGGAYWLAYLDDAGTAIAGFVDADGAVHATALGAASALELAVYSGAPRVVAADTDGISQTALCTE
jgi:hypothetical protein